MRQYLKIFIAAVVIVGALVWAVTSSLPSGYSGTSLKASIAQGAVTVTNPQDATVPVQLVSPGTRTFSVVSAIAGAAGTSTTVGTGKDATQLFELGLPAGVSEFTVTRGTNVSLVTPATPKLVVSVQPLTQNDARTTLIVAVVVILGALYYISRTTNHRWIGMIRGQVAPVPVVAPVVVASNSQGAEIRAYGDNRANRT